PQIPAAIAAGHVGGVDAAIHDRRRETALGGEDAQASGARLNDSALLSTFALYPDCPRPPGSDALPHERTLRHQYFSAWTFLLARVPSADRRLLSLRRQRVHDPVRGPGGEPGRRDAKSLRLHW